jgi:phosphoribosyl-AMP cyclohydrolase
MIENVKFNTDGLVPVIAQCDETGDILMMAWMNAESLDITLKTGRVTYYSRSRQELWEKGLTSGHTQTLVGAKLDCDGDTILLTVHQVGAACHQGTRSCFNRTMPISNGA